MQLTMHGIAVVPLLRGLASLERYVDAAEIFAKARKIDAAVLMQARLFPDMLSFAGQIQRASDSCKGGMGRLTGIEVPSWSDTEADFDELRSRISKTVDFLKSVPKERFDDSAGRTIELKFRTASGVLDGVSYVATFMLPNFFFHVTTAHDILRHCGVEVGKRDYLGPLESS
jgi:hypothetical protein